MNKNQDVNTNYVGCMAHVVWGLCVCEGCKKGCGAETFVEMRQTSTKNLAKCAGWFTRMDNAIRQYTTALRGAVLAKKIACCSDWTTQKNGKAVAYKGYPDYMGRLAGQGQCSCEDAMYQKQCADSRYNGQKTGFRLPTGVAFKDTCDPAAPMRPRNQARRICGKDVHGKRPKSQAAAVKAAVKSAHTTDRCGYHNYKDVTKAPRAHMKHSEICLTHFPNCRITFTVFMLIAQSMLMSQAMFWITRLLRKHICAVTKPSVSKVSK